MRPRRENRHVPGESAQHTKRLFVLGIFVLGILVVLAVFALIRAVTM